MTDGISDGQIVRSPAEAAAMASTYYAIGKKSKISISLRKNALPCVRRFLEKESRPPTRS